MSDDSDNGNGEGKTPAKRRANGTFLPGVSGNPRGYHGSTIELRNLARRHDAECIEILISIARDTKQPALSRVRAVQELFDRGHGHAPQTFNADETTIVDPTGAIGDTSGVSALLLRAQMARDGKLNS
jgi:hypothetical protein